MDPSEAGSDAVAWSVWAQEQAQCQDSDVARER